VDVKGEVLLELFSKSKFRNGTETFLESNFSLFIVKFKKIRFSAPLSTLPTDTTSKHAGISPYYPFLC